MWPGRQGSPIPPSSRAFRTAADRAGDPERIRRLCDEMGYTKNYIARSMVMKKTDLIGLVVPSIDNHYMSELAYYAEVRAQARGYNIMLCNSAPDLRQERTVVQLLMNRQVDGILIVPQEHHSCEDLKPYADQVPMVFLSEDLRGPAPELCHHRQCPGCLSGRGVSLQPGTPGHPVFRPASGRHPPAAGGGIPPGLPGHGADAAGGGQQLLPLLS